MELQKHKEIIRTWISSFGFWGPLIFIGIQISQVILSPVPGELTGLLGGYLYGVWLSSIYSTIGLTIGSWLAFMLGRVLGRSYVQRFFSVNLLRKFEFLTTNKGSTIVLILFLIPGFPKDIMCFLLGLSPINSITFTLLAFLGRIPGTIMLSFQGASFYDEKYSVFIWLLVLSIALIFAIYFFSDSIRGWLKTKAK
ncbi:MAG: TVP38/TMEM64 family protein [Nitrospinota bacterium]|nr:TVP38/TMEM64 family protein [Nitrospinota bacterium]